MMAVIAARFHSSSSVRWYCCKHNEVLYKVGQCSSHLRMNEEQIFNELIVSERPRIG